MVSFGSRALALGAVLSLAIGSSALAQQNNWSSCDGYGAASRGGDGMTGYANVFLIFNPPGYGTTARSDVGTGPGAIAACDRALDALATPHWRRRINLLQARALHKASTGQGESALEDLDLADQAAVAGQGDALFERSQGVGLMLSRAYVLERLNRDDDARGWLARARDARPYDRGVAAIVAGLGGGGSTNAFDRTAQNHRARLEPRGRSVVAMDFFNERRFEDFLAVEPYLMPPRSYPQLNELPVSVGLRELRDHERSVEFRVTVGSLTGYALATVGRYEEADQAFARARAILEAGRQTPTPPALRGPALQQYSERLTGSWGRLSPMQAMIDEMAQAAQRRRMVASGQVEAVIQSLADEPLLADATGVDTLLAIAEALPPDDAAPAREAAERLSATLSQRDQARAAPAFALNDLFAALPAAETADRLSAWREAKRPFLAMEGSPADRDAVGYRESTGGDGVVTVRFRGGDSPQSQIEEMALLRAAELARQGGHAGFVLVDRRDTEWSTQTTQYGVPLRSDPNGFESEIDIRFAEAGAPDASNGMNLVADEVIAALGPLYIREQPRRR